MSCALRWRRITRSCVRPSKPTTARCSTTPAMGCARYSPLRVPPSMPPSPRSELSNCRCGWVSPRARRSCAGDDYFGTVLNRAARVMAAGHGGQILLDGITASLISGVDLIALGPKRLRDIAKPVDVFQVQSDGLRTEFPALKTVDSAPGNLRPRSTSFIGRETELAELEDTLKAHRFVTLTGVGGVGKTRLALEVAARLSEQLPRRSVGDRARSRHRPCRGARRRRDRSRHHPTTGNEPGR